MDSGHRVKSLLPNHKWGLGYRETVKGYGGHIRPISFLIRTSGKECHSQAGLTRAQEKRNHDMILEGKWN